MKKEWKVLIGIIVGLVLCFGGNFLIQSLPSVRLSKAVRLYDNEDYKEAEGILKELLEDDPYNEKLIYLLADVYEEDEAYDDLNDLMEEVYENIDEFEKEEYVLYEIDDYVDEIASEDNEELGDWLMDYYLEYEIGDDDNVVDLADLLSEKAEENLVATCEYIVVKYGLEPVIVTINDDGGKSSMEYADDYFDYNGYGVGKDNEGIVMLINMEEREIWLSTTGDDTIAEFQKDIDIIVEAVTPFLSDGDYDGGAEEFLDEVVRVVGE